MSETLTLRQFAALVPCCIPALRNVLWGRSHRGAVLPKFWKETGAGGLQEWFLFDAQSVQAWLAFREEERQRLGKPHLRWPIKDEERRAA